MSAVTRRRTPGYRSGHCTGGTVGGHERCRYVCEGITCRCWCHTVERLPGSRYVDDYDHAWTYVNGLGWRH